MLEKSLDIRAYKKKLRETYKQIREQMPPQAKRAADEAILAHVLNSAPYRRAKTLLCYVSMETEVDTRALIEAALQDGKVVAVPRCAREKRVMHFYRITSLEGLLPGTFGVLEPKADTGAKISRFSDSLCILPGLAFDRYGYRLGYGGGYYDCFLSKGYSGVTMGVCYRECTLPHLRRGSFDVPCRYLVTQNGLQAL